MEPEQLTICLKYGHSDIAVFTISVIFVLSIAVFSQFLGLGAILGALAAGLVLQVSVNRKIEFQLVENYKLLTFGLVIPFFFIVVGLNFDLMSIIKYPLIPLLIFVAAVAAKLIASFMAKSLAGLSSRQALLMGLGMSSRGAVELVIVYYAFINHLIPASIYSAIVAMALATTLIFPVALRYFVGKYPRIMD